MTKLSAMSSSRDELYGAGHGQRQLDEFEDQLLDPSAWPVPDQVAFRIDFHAFLTTLSYRDRRLLRFLAQGNTGEQAAAVFNLPAARINDLRGRWRRKWHAMHGEAVPA